MSKYKPYSYRSKCKTCNGQRKVFDEICPDCGGTGLELPDNEKLTSNVDLWDK